MGLGSNRKDRSSYLDSNLYLFSKKGPLGVDVVALWFYIDIVVLYSLDHCCLR